ncbi:T9SS type A sorting domain-containing protein [Flavobacterium sp.]|uniref:T9SS type A sorting domain-containing protein n=1 Tax=Flavobacterium sp. TaxID=239 RepID=UPI0025C024AA|nr:T9SS type A sorting domain-containing protein [Flavobacterium sp.]
MFGRFRLLLNTSSITVSISGGVSGSISVRSVSACGISLPRTVSVGSSPILGTISGSTIVCGAVQTTIDTNGQVLNSNPSNQYTYKVSLVPGVTSYQWSVPAGATLVSGQGSNIIVVSYDLSSFNSGLISVQGVNGCGTGVARTLSVSTVTGNISGPSNICGLTTATYSVPSDLGNNFVWTLPTGMAITNGQGTSSITVSISHPLDFASSNQVSVSFTTACGGSKSLNFIVNCNEYTKLTASYCGATNIAPSQWLFVNSVSGATAYKYNVYDATGTNLVFSTERSVSYFRFLENTFTYGTTYKVRVQVKRGDTYGIEGVACSVTIQDANAALQAAYCGATNVTPSQWLFVNNVVGATAYKYNVYDAAGTSLVFSTERSVNFFRFLENTFAYGTTYQVRVQVKQGGVYGVEGSACSVTIQGLPVTSLDTSSCGASNVTPYQLLSANSVVGATGYKFNIYDEAGTTLLFSQERSVPNFRFLDNPFVYGQIYQVKVQVKQGGVYGSEGSACSVLLSKMPLVTLVASQCNSTISTASDIIYATAVAGVTTYRFTIYDSNSNQVAQIERPNNYFKLNDFAYVPGVTYSVAVATKQEGQSYGLNGGLCTVSTPAPVVRVTAVDQAHKVHVSNVESIKVYPNPFQSGFVIVPIASDLGAKVSYEVFDLTGKLIESNELSVEVIQNYTIGQEYARGMYIVNITQGTSSQSFKMIKQ